MKHVLFFRSGVILYILRHLSQSLNSWCHEQVLVIWPLYSTNTLDLREGTHPKKTRKLKAQFSFNYIDIRLNTCSQPIIYQHIVPDIFKWGYSGAFQIVTLCTSYAAGSIGSSSIWSDPCAYWLPLLHSKCTHGRFIRLRRVHHAGATKGFRAY